MELTEALDRYEDIDYTFSGSREGKLLRVRILTTFNIDVKLPRECMGYRCLLVLSALVGCEPSQVVQPNCSLFELWSSPVQDIFGRPLDLCGLGGMQCVKGGFLGAGSG